LRKSRHLPHQKEPVLKNEPEQQKLEPKKSESDKNQSVPVGEKEKQQVQERVAIGVNVVYEAIRLEGEEELSRRAAALAWSGLAAGLSMGFSFISEALLMSHLPDQHWRPLISKTGYCIGFLVVVLGRQQLFTENTLTVILPLLVRKSLGTFLNVLRLWAVVLSANLVGTFLFALFVAHSSLLTSEVHNSLSAIGAAHLVAGFATVFVRAIFAGWLIALMVWLLPGAESSRVIIIILLTYLIGLGHFTHIIAGSTTLFYLIAMHSLSWGAYFLHFFLPTLLGNILGGVSLVAALGHAQVLTGED
jgi:formate/nitrite transporter FocA (FNT family)